MLSPLSIGEPGRLVDVAIVDYYGTSIYPNIPRRRRPGRPCGSHPRSTEFDPPPANRVVDGRLQAGQGATGFG